MNNYKTGKIYVIDNDEGIGYVIDGEKKYLFTITDSFTLFKELKKDDIVRFRAERVNDTDRAFFVRKALKKEKNNLN